MHRHRATTGFPTARQGGPRVAANNNRNNNARPPQAGD